MSNTYSGIFLSNADGTLEEYANNLSGEGGDTSALANKTDLTAIILTGTTNTSGDVISAGTWFYLNGTPCIAKVDIASGATFTESTNYEEKTIGEELSELNSNLVIENGDYFGVVNKNNTNNTTDIIIFVPKMKPNSKTLSAITWLEIQTLAVITQYADISNAVYKNGAIYMTTSLPWNDDYAKQAVLAALSFS